MKFTRHLFLLFFLVFLFFACQKEEPIPDGADFQSFSSSGFSKLSAEISSVYSIAKSPDGGFIMAGEGEDRDLALMKLDNQGVQEWLYFFSIPEAEVIRGRDVVSALDGGYLVAGWASILNGTDFLADAYMLKTDQDGIQEWAVNFGGEFDQQPESAISLEDGGYIFVGKSRVSNIFSNMLYLGRIDSHGNEIWTKEISRSTDDSGYSIVKAGMDEFLILSVSTVSNTLDGEAVLTKIDIDGTVLWTQALGASGVSLLNQVQIINTSDNGFLVVSNRRGSNTNLDIHLIKVDTYGMKEWEQTYGGSKLESSKSLIATRDSAYVILGSTYSYGNGSSDIFLIKVDKSGKMLWMRTYGDDDIDSASGLQEKENGGFIIIGAQGHEKGPFNFQAIILETNSEGIPE